MKAVRNRQLFHLISQTRSDRTNHHSRKVRAVVAKNGVPLPTVKYSSRQKAVKVVCKIFFEIRARHCRLRHRHRNDASLEPGHRVIRSRDLMFNASAGTAFGRMTYVPSVTIESSALNDPSLIDPTTGNPFNGSFTTTGIGTYSTTKTLASGATEFQALSYSRANTLGFSRTYFAGLGLPSNVIDDLFKRPMTIRLNVRVSSRWVDSATMLFTIRFLGN